eukprot:TRINITY_DN19774_c0_g1_i1.p1 TRINITY_DN19774_c0_g1~~TRINITY_DN19774_c0_g1_i1.p1  ORF type:complete len:221 (-),score=38.97 TRINITY_DN19774_c0_g1_i1:179-841(-)
MSSEPLQKNDGVDERGIPTKSEYPPLPIPALYGIMTTIFIGVGLAIAFGIYTLGSTSRYDSKISTLAAGDLGWAYLGLFVTKLCMFLTNVNLGMARKESKVNVPDQQVYKVYTGSEKPLGYVLMEQEGVLGRFNRAQRALQNSLEAMPTFLANFLLAAYVFPFPALVAATWYGLCRVAYAFGYTSDPKSRIGGTMLGQFGNQAIEGMVLLAGAKALMRAH